MSFDIMRFLLAETISPALENTLSLGTEVAGMLRYFLAAFAMPSSQTDCPLFLALKGAWLFRCCISWEAKLVSAACVKLFGISDQAR